MDRSQFNTAPAAVKPEQVRREEPQQVEGAQRPAPAAPQVLDERLLAQVVGGLPRVGGW
ncbi:hypothetical protein V4F39_22965 [Aquincola sp. MAHUQ-54]|uniref:Uncharacterized protein n=1 Tax=Aquincola agrisoli TaxID=3119538 RepID=A0AAW9QC59_9BURK